MHRIIISGATGVIGTALIQECLKQKIQMLILCNPGSARNSCIPDSPLIQKVECALEHLGELNPDVLVSGDGLYQTYHYDVFYHLAWMGTTGAARNDMDLQNRNVKYALDAVRLAHRFGCKIFIGAGSQAEYGRVEGLLRPDTPTFPEMGYGIGKLCAGMMTRELAHQLGMQHVWVRVLSIYGPGDGAGSMVMSAIHKLQAGEVPQFTKGEQLWDYLYSEDAARAFLMLGQKAVEDAEKAVSMSLVDGKVYVLGSGRAAPLASYILTIRDVVAPGGQVDLGAVPYSPKQVMHLQADVSALEKDLGWRAEKNFAEGIREIVQFEGRSDSRN